MNTEAINDKNFILFCASHYDNYEYSSTEDFFDDLKRIKYIKKLVTRYVEKGDLKERLILNHIIVLNNCFGAEITAKILFLLGNLFCINFCYRRNSLRANRKLFVAERKSKSA